MHVNGLLRRGLDELLLAGVILVMITGAALTVALYLRPREHLLIPELQPVIRIARVDDFPIGSSRIRHWGERTVLVIRTDSTRYYALQGTSPGDGCTLRWDPEALRIFSPCTYIVYDLRGDVVGGLSREPLKRYAVSVRDGVVYVSELER
jgi:nitrite reductase/ring-hydroxylating ferredoxin subunit